MASNPFEKKSFVVWRPFTLPALDEREGFSEHGMALYWNESSRIGRAMESNRRALSYANEAGDTILAEVAQQIAGASNLEIAHGNAEAGAQFLTAFHYGSKTTARIIVERGVFVI